MVGVEIPAALKALGYIGSDLFASIHSDTPQPSESSSSSLPPEVQQALRAVPPRPYTDLLVAGFFTHVNYHYEAVHQPTFMREYAEWWDRRRDAQGAVAFSDVALTSLVLQMCANAAQFVEPSALEKLESELGEAMESLAERLFDAAQRLSTFIPPGEGGVVMVQRLFLGGGWLKNRVEVTRSWHLLGSAVREAQEIGRCWSSPRPNSPSTLLLGQEYVS
jgi:hypothetical protein